jgi:hypothetical protein
MTPTTDLARVVLSHRLWRDIGGADPDIIGRVIDLDGRACEVIGVMRRGSRPSPGCAPESPSRRPGPDRRDDGWPPLGVPGWRRGQDPPGHTAPDRCRRRLARFPGRPDGRRRPGAPDRLSTLRTSSWPGASVNPETSQSVPRWAPTGPGWSRSGSPRASWSRWLVGWSVRWSRSGESGSSWR